MADEIQVYRSPGRASTQRWRWRCVCRRTRNTLFGSSEGYGRRAEVLRRLRKLQERGVLGSHLPVICKD